MKFFENVSNLEDLKKEYKKLAKVYHPDLGGNEEIMKKLNNDYDSLFNLLKGSNNANSENRKVYETPEQTREFLNKIMMLDVDVEICGSWLYITGNTKEVKEQLKELKCNWSKNKKCWYWFPNIENSKKRRGHYNMNEIRNKYGSEKINGSMRLGA